MSKPTELKNNTQPLTILHTSDWHLGRRLYGQMRYDEFEAFLEWLEDTISQYHVDVLIVAGDIFDTMTPSNRAQSLYYEFLGCVSKSRAKSCCQHIVIVAGNHDSPTFLDAPSNVLKFLNVHVIGTACENLEDEVLTLSDNEGNPYCIVTAVPYLRDRDVRSSSAGESSEDKDSKVVAGIQTHYDSVADIAKAKQNEINKQLERHIPIIATGHLFASGGRTTDDDGVRDLYVGNLGKISAELFDACFDYVALGHLHVPQRVGGREHIRYSGSPIPMGFGEARQQKQVLLIQFGEACDNLLPSSSAFNATSTSDALSTLDNTSKPLVQKSETSESKTAVKPQKTSHAYMDDLFADMEDDDEDNTVMVNEHNNEQTKPIETNIQSTDKMPEPAVIYHDESNQMRVVTIPVPCFQKLVQIKGNMAFIESTIADLPTDNAIWLEIIYESNEIVSNLNEQVQGLIEDTPFKALKIKNSSVYDKVLKSESVNETLQDLDEKEVFERCMTIHDIADSQKDALRLAYQQILFDAFNKDSNSGEV